MTEWQPIETAPKDGTAFLAAYKQGLAIARWSERRMGKPSAFITVHGAHARDFTHWMPLPKAPNAGAK